MYNAKAYSATSESSPLASTTIARRDPNEHDVQIQILFCGICHSDLHSARNEWSEFSATVYPIVPGHEIIGRVTKVGAAVTKFKIGDLAAVGCMVDSDRTCNQCKEALPQKSESRLDRVSTGSGSDLVKPMGVKIVRKDRLLITDQVATAPCTDPIQQ